MNMIFFRTITLGPTALSIERLFKKSFLWASSLDPVIRFFEYFQCCKVSRVEAR